MFGLLSDLAGREFGLLCDLAGETVWPVVLPRWRESLVCCVMEQETEFGLLCDLAGERVWPAV